MKDRDVTKFIRFQKEATSNERDGLFLYFTFVNVRKYAIVAPNATKARDGTITFCVVRLEQ
jgi:hypothetical protein